MVTWCESVCCVAVQVSFIKVDFYCMAVGYQLPSMLGQLGENRG